MTTGMGMEPMGTGVAKGELEPPRYRLLRRTSSLSEPLRRCNLFRGSYLGLLECFSASLAEQGQGSAAKLLQR